MAIIFDVLQGFRALIDRWGITADSLWIVAVVAGLFCILSLREVMGWFFRVNHLREEIRQMRAENKALHRSLDRLHEILNTEIPEVQIAPPTADEPTVASALETPMALKPEAKVDSSTPPSKRFNFDH